MEEAGISIGGAEELSAWRQRGNHAVGIDGSISGICSSQSIKDSSKSHRELKNMGLEVYMITETIKDSQGYCRKVGIKNVLAKLLPENKAEVVEL